MERNKKSTRHLITYKSVHLKRINKPPPTTTTATERGHISQQELKSASSKAREPVKLGNSVLLTLRRAIHYCQAIFTLPTVATRLKLAAKLQQGISMERILDDIRDSVEDGANRKHLITRQDLHNIRHQYNIEGIHRDHNDLTSVTAWVEEMKDQEYNPVLVYKTQGQEQTAEMNNLSKIDFILEIQTKFQRDMLVKFSNTACIDTTHGTNAYDFSLRIMVIDEFGEGIPVGWMVSNREDCLVVIAFLRTVRERCGMLDTKWFMSDDAEHFTAWRATFGDQKTQKLCAWHVDRAWRNALHDHVTGKESQVTIYHHLRVLLQETEEAHFRARLQEFLTFLKEKHPRFYTYFNTNYCSRLDQWSSCYRKYFNVNTNMFLEAFHRVLKVIYLHNKQNRRIDTLLTTLLKISRDKAFERFRKLEIGKASHRLSEINKRHKSAEEMTTTQTHKYQQVSPCKWLVQSQRDPQLSYTVQIDTSACQCQLVCNKCSICVHMCSCSCLDAVLHSTICKHVHYIVIKEQLRPRSHTSHSPATDHRQYFSSILAQGTTTETDKQRTKKVLHSSTLQLQSLITDCCEKDGFSSSTVLAQIRLAIAVVRAFKNRSQFSMKRLPTKRKYAPNKNHEKQKFQSTKKKKNLILKKYFLNLH